MHIAYGIKVGGILLSCRLSWYGPFNRPPLLSTCANLFYLRCICVNKEIPKLAKDASTAYCAAVRAITFFSGMLLFCMIGHVSACRRCCHSFISKAQAVAASIARYSCSGRTSMYICHNARGSRLMLQSKQAMNFNEPNYVFTA